MLYIREGPLKVTKELTFRTLKFNGPEHRKQIKLEVIKNKYKKGY